MLIFFFVPEMSNLCDPFCMPASIITGAGLVGNCAQSPAAQAGEKGDGRKSRACVLGFQERVQ